MLRFLRKIRRDLSANSQFFKYLKYAIGEILLVVIGILIALYINNRNEHRKEQQKFDMVLVDVEKELIGNISWTREVIYELEIKDSLYLKFFIDSVQFEEYWYYNSIILGGSKLSSIRDESFQKLTQINNISHQQEIILDELIGLYRTETFVEQFGELVAEISRSNRSTLKNYEWYDKWVFGQPDDRIVDFFINDPEYRKMAAEHFIYVGYYRNSLSLYDFLAVPVYTKIHDYLDNLEVKRTDSLSLEYDLNDYAHYLGKYEIKWFSNKNFKPEDYSIVISKSNEKLIWTVHETDRPDLRYEIIPINKYRFRFNNHGDMGSFHLEFDDQEEVTGGRYIDKNFIMDLRRVR